ncbi:MAG: hypothetical protein ACUZ8E_04835 [Candidatus Anammoxibacter sp.]
MGKIRRSNYVFLVWKGDHSPKHVHVYKDSKLLLKWDIENNKEMKGKSTKKLIALLDELKEDGLL